MPRDIFASAPPAQLRRSSRWTVPISIVAHIAVIAAFVIASFAAPLASPEVRERLDIFLAPPAPLPVLPPPAPAPTRPAATTVVNPAAAPIVVPEGIAPEKDVPPGAASPALGLGSDVGVEGGVPGGLLMSPQTVAAPPPPPPTAVKKDETPRPVGGNIKAPERISAVPPIYPPLAQTARVEGDVILEAVIGTDGRVRDVRVLRSMALLDETAMEAVKRWRYTPTRLNGIPVPVVMTVTVSFRLR